MSVPPVSSTNPLNPAASAHTLQGFIELVFGQVANSVLVGSLQSLQNSLTLTKNAMDTLTQIQNLHNDVSVISKGQFSFNFQQSAGKYEQSYQSAASAFFGTPMKISVKFPSGFSVFKTQIMQLQTQLSSEIKALSLVTPLISGREDPNSLVAKLHAVLNDIKTNNVSTLSGTTTWLTDHYNTVASTGVASAGQIQQNITNAITAGQSLNTTQTESVRNYLYLFEQYYKTASAMLQQITQLIQTMAQHIT